MSKNLVKLSIQTDRTWQPYTKPHYQVESEILDSKHYIKCFSR